MKVGIKETIKTILISACFSSTVGCVIIFLGVLMSMLPHLFDDSVAIIGSVFIFYLIYVVFSFFSLIAFSPIYLAIKKLGHANHINMFVIGFFVVLILYKFKISLNELYFYIAGGVIFSLFHYRFTSLKNI